MILLEGGVAVEPKELKERLKVLELRESRQAQEIMKLHRVIYLASLALEDGKDDVALSLLENCMGIEGS